MLWIVGGIVLAIIFLIIREKFYVYEVLLSFLAMLSFATGIGFGFFSPVKEYTEQVLIEEIELVSLSNNMASLGRTGMVYVSITDKNVYFFRYEKENKYNLNGKAYETNTLSNNKVTEIESKECTKPVLKVYEKRPKKNWIISFSIADIPIKEYVFYVPEGTIQKEIILN